MAVTATLVNASANRLRYQIVNDGAGGASVTITTTGAATPDILTDSVQGPIKKLAKAFTDGYARFAAGALNQSQSRNLWLSDDEALPSSLVVAGNNLIPTARCRLSIQNGADVAGWAVDANVDGGGHPTIVVSVYTLINEADPSDVFLDIEIPEAIG
jgi:hypothetical protein